MKLPRLQLFEFNDLAWMSTAVKDTVIESLSHALAWGRMLRGLVAPFERFLALSGAREVLDIGAGAGGPASILVQEIARAGRTPPRFLLTDLLPQVEVWQRLAARLPGQLDFVPEPVDATAIPPELSAGRARSIINVFHHFPPELGRAILADAVRSSRGVFLAEGLRRQPLEFANFAPAGLAALALNPILSHRDRLAKALLTWVTPAALAISAWDGFVSALRSYDEDELRAMVADLPGGWRWEHGTYHFPPLGTGCYFFGVPPT